MNDINIPKNKYDMIKLLEEVIHSQCSGPTEEIDDEKIALLASGKIDLLPEDQQKLLLKQVAADPVAAELVKDLADLNLTTEEDSKPAAFKRLVVMVRPIAAAWAVAACLTFGIFLWRTVEPPRPIQIPQVYGAEDSYPDYWLQAYQQKLSKFSSRDRYREYALIASTTACAVLSMAVVFCIISKKRDRQKKQA
jgi:hypothetical protein